MGFLSSIFGGGNKNQPGEAAMPYLNQIGPMAQQNLGPWQTQGQQAQVSNQGQLQRMAEEPVNFLDELKASYTPSAGYKFREENANKAAYGTAAAGGRVSTTTNQQAMRKLAKDLAAEDEDEFINQVLGIQKTGLQGQENIANRGYNAAGDLTNIQGTNLGQQGALAYTDQQNKNKKDRDFLKLIATLAGAGLGSFGGPAGAAAGASIGGSLVGGGDDTAFSKDNFANFGKGFGWGADKGTSAPNTALQYGPSPAWRGGS